MYKFLLKIFADKNEETTFHSPAKKKKSKKKHNGKFLRS